MILDTLHNAHRYHSLNPAFRAAFEFLVRPDLATLAPGRIPVDGDRVYAIVQQSPGRQRDQAPLELHRKYIDIQYLLAGTEEMGWRPTPDCHHPKAPFDPAKDIGFFHDAPQSWFTVPPACFVIFFPEDAHSASVSPGPLHKVVMKVAIS